MFDKVLTFILGAIFSISSNLGHVLLIKNINQKINVTKVFQVYNKDTTAKHAIALK